MRRFVIPAVAAGLAASRVPSAVCRQGADGWFHDDPATVERLSDAVDAYVSAPLSPTDYETGDDRFDGEWWFGTYQMAAAGFAQVALTHPELREANVRRMRETVDRLIRPEVWEFDRTAWGDLALADLDGEIHDHAVLGYLGITLGVERLVDPDGPHAALHDRVIALLERRVEQRGRKPLRTYPGEAFPVDNAAVLAAIGLHARATGTPAPAWLHDAVATWEASYVQPDGLLVQAINPENGDAWSEARGSGTALAAYFFGFTEPRLSRRLATAARDVLGGKVLGFGAVREYRAGYDGPGDIDSGPLILGWSISATGFSLAGARRLGDEGWFTDLYGTTCMTGIPGDAGFRTGGPLGNAILFAMLTAPPLPGD
jgi:hypothetical protein